MDEKPRLFEVDGDDLFHIVAREKAGEFIILSMDVGPKNSHYTVHVRYPEPRQAELIK